MIKIIITPLIKESIDYHFEYIFLVIVLHIFTYAHITHTPLIAPFLYLYKQISESFHVYLDSFMTT